MGVYGRGWHDSGIRGRVFSVGLLDLRNEHGCFWVGIVGACGCGAGGVFIGVCKYSSLVSGPPIPRKERPLADESATATICQLLRPNVHPLRAFFALLKFSLVFRQITHDRYAIAVV